MAVYPAIIFKEEKKMKKLLEEALALIENEDMRIFVDKLVETIPAYFFEVAASSTGKYHPSYALGEGGLVRHTLALVRILNHLFEMDCYKEEFDSRARDILRIAGIMHDTRKSGTQAEYEADYHTKFSHPLYAANVVRELKGSGLIPDDEIEKIADAIASHMGQWNISKYSDVVLPLPTTRLQKVLHAADYLASRKDLEVLF